MDEYGSWAYCQTNAIRKQKCRNWEKYLHQRLRKGQCLQNEHTLVSPRSKDRKGLARTKGRNRVPNPPTRIKAFILGRCKETTLTRQNQSKSRCNQEDKSQIGRWQPISVSTTRVCADVVVLERTAGDAKERFSRRIKGPQGLRSVYLGGQSEPPRDVLWHGHLNFKVATLPHELRTEIH